MVSTRVHIRTEQTKLTFVHLPVYARFLLNEQLDAFIQEQLRLARAVKVPLLSYLEALPEEELIALSRVTQTEFLTYLIQNRAEDQIAEAQKQWISDEMPIVGQRQVVAEDITLISYVRKQSLLKFLPAYTNDIQTILQIVQEIDEFTLEADTRATNTYIRLLNEQLNEQLHFNEKIAQASPGVIYLFDLLIFRDVYSNQKLGSVLGYETAELEAMGPGYILDLQHPEDTPHVMAHYQRFGDAVDGEIRTFEHRLRNKAGHYHWMRNYELIFRRTPDGKPWQIIGIALEVTTEKENAERLQQREAQLSEAQALAHIGSWTWEVEADKIIWSDEMFRLLGLEPQGRQFTFPEFIELVHPDDRQLVGEHVQHSLETAEPFEFVHRVIWADGSQRLLLAKGQVVRGAGGKVVRMFGTGQDVTEQKEAERRIQENTLLLEQSNDSLREFAYIASHDLKEPLRKISTFGERLLETERERMSGEGQMFLDRIISSSLRMQTMINDVLSVSLISANKAFERYSLQTVLEEVLQSLDHKIETRKAKIDAQPLPVAYVVPAQFRQLFLNLIGNSLKFARPDVPPVIRIRHRYLSPAQTTNLLLRKARQYHQLEFTDNGIGFDNRFASRIFAMFERLHGAQEYEGTGIGLAVCKRIVENHGGVIQASGELNVGTTFTLIFPA